MAQRTKRLLAIAPPFFLITVFISAWSQSQLVAWYKNDVAKENQYATSSLQSVPLSPLPAANRTLFLQQSDSLYRKYNMSLTPIVIEKYKLLFFTIEKTGSTVRGKHQCVVLSFVTLLISHEFFLI